MQLMLNRCYAPTWPKVCAAVSLSQMSAAVASSAASAVSADSQGKVVTLSYLAVIECKGNTYSGFLPDVPGCVAVGTSADDALIQLADAATEHLQLGLEYCELPPEAVTLQFIEEPDDSSGAPHDGSEVVKQATISVNVTIPRSLA